MSDYRFLLILVGLLIEPGKNFDSSSSSSSRTFTFAFSHVVPPSGKHHRHSRRTRPISLPTAAQFLSTGKYSSMEKIQSERRRFDHLDQRKSAENLREILSNRSERSVEHLGNLSCRSSRFDQLLLSNIRNANDSLPIQFSRSQ